VRVRRVRFGALVGRSRFLERQRFVAQRGLGQELCQVLDRELEHLDRLQHPRLEQHALLGALRESLAEFVAGHPPDYRRAGRNG
jgi:hypothetical protein